MCVSTSWKAGTSQYSFCVVARLHSRVPQEHCRLVASCCALLCLAASCACDRRSSILYKVKAKVDIHGHLFNHALSEETYGNLQCLATITARQDQYGSLEHLHYGRGWLASDVMHLQKCAQGCVHGARQLGWNGPCGRLSWLEQRVWQDLKVCASTIKQPKLFNR